jgi:hypothetical protein
MRGQPGIVHSCAGRYATRAREIAVLVCLDAEKPGIDPDIDIGTPTHAGRRRIHGKPSSARSTLRQAKTARSWMLALGPVGTSGGSVTWADAGCAAGRTHSACETTNESECALGDRPGIVPFFRPRALRPERPPGDAILISRGCPIGRLRLRQAHKAIKGATVGRVTPAKSAGNLPRRGRNDGGLPALHRPHEYGRGEAADRGPLRRLRGGPVNVCLWH